MTTPLTLRITVSEPGDDEEGVFLLTGADLIVGRDEGCDILIEDGSVSGRHGVFKVSGAGYTFTDLASSNGSALVRARGEARRGPSALAAGEPVPLGPGDELLLGDAQRPVRLSLSGGQAQPFSVAALPERTVVASAPLADLLGRRGDERLVDLAARALAAADASGLASAALSYLAQLAPRAAHRGVAIWGAGLGSGAGEPVPAGIKGAALERGEVVLFEEAGAPLPMTASVARQGVSAALAAPLLAGGSVHGVMAAWTPLGAAALPAAAVAELSVAASLVALSAAQLAVRLEGERRRQALEADNRRLGGRGAGRPVVEPVGQSAPFIAAVDLARSVAPSDVPLLLLGETGTGKEVLARNVHRWSRRADRPFVAFNCAAVPESLIESELFGHVRGAFTGAGADRRGLFEEAHGGTIFLDEIGEMPAVMQAKLLRVLQDGEVRRVGASKVSAVDVRVVSATHRDLTKLVAEGRFRADLMYRLNAVTLSIPPLRERGDDIALLAHFLLGLACEQARKRVPGFAPDALWALSRHDFPGNVRELGNEILRAVALTPEGEAIRARAFSERLAGKAPPAPAALASGGALTLKEIVKATERAAIEQAVARASGNISQAARELGLTRPGLYKVMERLGLR